MYATFLTCQADAAPLTFNHCGSQFATQRLLSVQYYIIIASFRYRSAPISGSVSVLGCDILFRIAFINQEK